MICWGCSTLDSKRLKCKEKVEVSMVGGQFGAFCFLLILQEISTESDQSTDETFSLFFQLWKQSKMSQKWSLSCGTCKQYGYSWNHNYLIWVQWERQQRTEWLKQELLWLPQSIDSKLCVVPSQLKNLYCLGDWGSLWSDFQIMLVTF